MWIYDRDPILYGVYFTLDGENLPIHRRCTIQVLVLSLLFFLVIAGSVCLYLLFRFRKSHLSLKSIATMLRPRALLRDTINLTPFPRPQPTWKPLACVTHFRARCLATSPHPTAKTHVHPAFHYEPKFSFATPSARLFWSKSEAPIIPTNTPGSYGVPLTSTPGNKDGKVVGSTSTYPPRLLIYYAGRRTVWLACTKLCTLFVAAFAAGVIAPAWYWEIVNFGAGERASAAENEGEKEVVVVKEEKEENLRRKMFKFKFPTWAPGVGDREITIPTKTAGILAAVGIAVMGSIPFLMMQYFSPPYVTHLHLHLPPYARHSSPNLLRFLNHLHPVTPLSLVTIRLLGQPTQHTFPVGQLRRESRLAGCANLVWRGWRSCFMLTKGGVRLGRRMGGWLRLEWCWQRWGSGRRKGGQRRMGRRK
ncbi:hypothetical protein L211DRAFT_423109 [Terfezia boudieri ATCC MYA-4762]|uniref:Uncharacterized protein n=1 Tax=Terfezia boudieri ATCC MYA-4762 TaxID=1051890 RepID=A0A3N4LFC5_9PEZI|nr:hypothetical protein L211DRAFT_423109 [Terfezia boudieri ATCC MYA-4762]